MPNEELLAPKARLLLAQVKRWQENLFYGKKCHYPFADLPHSAHLRYVLTNWTNYTIYLDLFQNDQSLFVDERFKNKALLDEYAVGLLEIMYYDNKRAGCDWVLQLHSGEPIGILHLYDLNGETIADRYPPCSIGYAITANHRQQGYAYEAVTHLLYHIKNTFNRDEVRANTHSNNEASIRLLQKCNFQRIGISIGEESDDADTLLIFSKQLT
ncbi:GNAT family N-acetyltransferase [Rhodoflexus sp.]